MWTVTGREGGHELRTVLQIVHDPKRGAFSVSAVRDLPGDDHGGEGSYFKRFVNALTAINVYEKWEAGGGLLLKPWHISYEGTFSADLSLRGSDELTGAVVVELPHYKSPTGSVLKETIPTTWRRWVPRVERAEPRVVTADDVKAAGGKVKLEITGEGLPAPWWTASELHDYAFDDPAITGVAVARVEDHPWRKIGLTLETRNLAPGPKGMTVLGRKVPAVFHVVDPVRELRFEDAGEAPVQVAGFRKRLRAVLRFAEGKTPEADTIAAEVTRYDTAAKPERAGEAKAFELERDPKARSVYRSTKWLVLRAPEQTRPAAEDEIVTEAEDFDRIEAVVRDRERATLYVDDPCRRLKKRLDALNAEIATLEVNVLPNVRSIAAGLLEAESKWAEVATMTPNPTEALKALADELAADQGSCAEIGSHLVPEAKRYLSAAGTDPGIIGTRRGELPGLKEAIGKMPDPRATDLGTVLSSYLDAFMKIDAACSPIEAGEFPELPDEPMSSWWVTPQSFPGEAGQKAAEGACPATVFDDGATTIQFSRPTTAEERRALEKACPAAAKAAALDSRIRDFGFLAKSMDRRATKGHVELAREFRKALAEGKARWEAWREELDSRHRAMKQEARALLEAYLDCLIKHGHGDDLVSEFADLKARAQKRFEDFNRELDATEKELKAWKARMRAGLAALQGKVSKSYQLLVEMMDANRAFAFEKEFKRDLPVLDLMMMGVAIGELSGQGVNWLRGKMLPQGGRLSAHELSQGLPSDVRAALGDEAIAGMAKKGVGASELGELAHHLKSGKGADEAMELLKGKRPATGEDIKEAMKAAGMDETTAGKLAIRVADDAMTVNEVKDFAKLAKAIKEGDHATIQKAVDHLKGSIEQVQKEQGVDLVVLSVGTGTDVDRLFSGKFNSLKELQEAKKAEGLKAWECVKSDWDGAILFHPDQRGEQIQKVMKSIPADDMVKLESELKRGVSLADLRVEATKAATAGDAERAAALKKQVELAEETIALKHLEKEYKRVFRKNAGYPSTAPDFNLFGDSPFKTAKVTGKADDLLRDRTALARHVVMDSDGILFTPGGRGGQIDLMRAGESPMAFDRATGTWKALDQAAHEKLFPGGELNAAHGADLVLENGAFFHQNLRKKYHAPLEALQEASDRLAKGGALTAKEADAFVTAASKTSKYYARAALGKMAAVPELGRKMRELFRNKIRAYEERKLAEAAAAGKELKFTPKPGPEEVVLEIAREEGKALGIFTPDELKRLEAAISTKGSKSLDGPGAVKMLSDWGGDIRQWADETAGASRNYFKDEIAKAKAAGDSAKAAHLEDLRQTHELTRDLTLSRLPGDDLTKAMGLSPSRARAIDAMRRADAAQGLTSLEAPALVNLTAGGGGLSDMTHALLRSADEPGKAWYDVLPELPAEWGKKLAEFKQQGGFKGYAKLCGHVAWNVFTSPGESLARMFMMAYRWCLVDGKAHTRVSSAMAGTTSGIEQLLEWELLPLAGGVPWVGGPEADLILLDREIDAFEERLKTVSSPVLAKVKKEYEEWKAVELERERRALLMSWGTVDDLSKRCRGVGSAFLQEAVKGDGKSTTVGKLWIDLMAQMRKYVDDQNTYYQMEYIESPKVLGPLAILNSVALAGIRELDGEK